jgi:protein phosphatase
MDPSASESQTIRIESSGSVNRVRPIAVQSFGRTDAGRVRKSNEDQFLIAELARTMWIHQSSLSQPQIQYGGHRAHIFLVADGMGGHNAGEVASALSVSTVVGFILNVLRRFSNLRRAEEAAVLEEFQNAIQKAHARVIDEGSHHPEFSGMGTTFTMAFTSNWNVFVVHAGDSRCYLFRHGTLRQLTTDHTLVEALIRRGALRPEDAARHLYRHVVVNVVGGTSPEIQGEVQRADLQPDDVLLLCTDGVTDMLGNDRITAILQAEPDAQGACDRLIEESIARGGKDNVTAVVARFSMADE